MTEGVDFVRSILLFEEVYQLEDIGRGGHPFSWIGDAEVRRESQFFKAPVRYILNILIHVIGIGPQNSFWKHVFVVITFKLYSLNYDISYFFREFFGQELGIFFKDRMNELNSEFQVKRLVAEHPIDH